MTLANLPEGVTAYKAAVTGTTVKFTALDQTVLANTGILLEGPASETVNIPVATNGNDLSDNDFLVNTTGGTFDAESGCTYFGMMKATTASDPIVFGIFNPVSVAIPANKAYLKVGTTEARSLSVVFDDGNTTGIADISSKADAISGEYFDLQGRKVAQPTKGLYIVNGKKYVVK